MRTLYYIGDEVQFKESIFKTQYVSPLYSVYQGHKFEVVGYLIDDDERPVTDHLMLKCKTGEIKLGGAVHDTDVEYTQEFAKPQGQSFLGSAVDSLVSIDFVNAGIDLASSIPWRTPEVKSEALVGGGGTFDGAGASGDWTDTIGDQVTSTISSISEATGGVLSGAIETTSSIVGGVGDTIGSIAEGAGDIAGGLGDIFGSIDL